MGRTVPTYRDAIEERLARWEREFGRALQDPADREAFRELLRGARRYVAQGTLMSTGDLSERIVLSILLSLHRAAPTGGGRVEGTVPGDIDADGNLIGELPPEGRRAEPRRLLDDR
ncbi:MAG: hypothetical protein ACRECR_03810 [Thermoplasmata archaeon]